MINVREITITVFALVFVLAVSVLGFQNPTAAIIITSLLLIFIFFLLTKKDYFPAVSAAVITFCVSYNMIREGAILLLLLIAIYAFLFLTKREYRINRIKSNYVVFFIFWLIYASFQLIYADQTTRALNHYQSLIVGVLFMVFLSQVINSKERLNMIINAWGLFYLSVLMLALWEINTGNHIGGRFGSYNRPGVATGGFFNQNNLSFYLAMGLPVAFYWTKKRWFLKILGLLMILTSFYIVHVNSTRSIVALYALFIFIFLAKLVFEKRRKLFSFLMAVVTVFVIFQWSMIYDAAISVITVNDDASVTYRNVLIMQGLEVFARNPIFGVGSGNLEQYNGGLNVHHYWVEILANYGAIIFSGLVFFFISCMLTFLRYRGDETLNNVAWTVFLCALMFIPAANTPSSSFQIVTTWFLFAMMICTVNVIKKEKEHISENKVGGIKYLEHPANH